MYVANVCGCAGVLPDRCEVNGDLFTRVKAKLFEELDVLRVKVLAMLLKESFLLRKEGDVSKLCRDEDQLNQLWGSQHAAALWTYW